MDAMLDESIADGIRWLIPDDSKRWVIDFTLSSLSSCNWKSANGLSKRKVEQRNYITWPIRKSKRLLGHVNPPPRVPSENEYETYFNKSDELCKPMKVILAAQKYKNNDAYDDWYGNTLKRRKFWHILSRMGENSIFQASDTHNAISNLLKFENENIVCSEFTITMTSVGW